MSDAAPLRIRWVLRTSYARPRLVVPCKTCGFAVADPDSPSGTKRAKHNCAHVRHAINLGRWSDLRTKAFSRPWRQGTRAHKLYELADVDGLNDAGAWSALADYLISIDDPFGETIMLALKQMECP